MLTYIQRGVGLMALLSIHLMGSENPYFQADGQPPVYLVTGTIHHRGLAWTHEGDTLTIKPLADQPPVPFQQLEIGYPTGTVALGCGVKTDLFEIRANAVNCPKLGSDVQPDGCALEAQFITVLGRCHIKAEKLLIERHPFHQAANPSSDSAAGLHAQVERGLFIQTLNGERISSRSVGVLGGVCFTSQADIRTTTQSTQ